MSVRSRALGVSALIYVTKWRHQPSSHRLIVSRSGRPHISSLTVIERMGAAPFVERRRREIAPNREANQGHYQKEKKHHHEALKA